MVALKITADKPVGHVTRPRRLFDRAAEPMIPDEKS
jgi:hypothetical protein